MDEPNRERAFAEYFSRRKENADALANLAIGNFIEMRDKTASKTFRAKKKLDHVLEAALPGIYPALHDGHFHTDSVRNSSQTRPLSGQDHL